MTYWHQVGSLRQLATYMINRGIDPTVLLQKNGLPASTFLCADAWLERGTCFRMASDLSLLAGDDLMGLHLGEVQPLLDFGLWGHRILGSAKLGDAFASAEEHVNLLQHGTWVTVVPVGDQVQVSVGFAGTLEAPSTFQDQANVMALLQILALASEAVPAEVSVSFAKPRLSSEIERLLGSRVRFGADVNQIQFDRGALELPLRDIRYVQAEHGVVLPARSPIMIGRQVYQHIHDAIGSDSLAIGAVASKLGLCVRTLQRRLAVWGLTYEQVLDDYRRLYGLAALQQGTHSVTDIAFQLGYSDSAHFTRAVRRWTGLCPRQVRLDHVAVAVRQPSGSKGEDGSCATVYRTAGRLSWTTPQMYPVSHAVEHKIVSAPLQSNVGMP